MYIRTIGAVAVATLVAASAYAQNVKTDADPSAPFSAYKTYSWTMGTQSLESLGEQRIRSAVDGQMSAKGFRLATDETPDVYMATHVLTHQEPQVIANGFGPWAFGGGFGTIDVNTLVQGTLVVDMYDAKTKKMVWRGVATNTVSDKPSKNTSLINKAVDKMFRRYPPSTN
jgi:hypothetical protein